jgi:hypothetical protein
MKKFLVRPDVLSSCQIIRKNESFRNLKSWFKRTGLNLLIQTGQLSLHEIQDQPCTFSRLSHRNEMAGFGDDRQFII